MQNPFGYSKRYLELIYTRSGIPMNDPLIQFVKAKRKAVKMTQHNLADRAGVGVRFIRDLEQGKASLRLDKVNQVLGLFGHRMAPAPFREAVDDEKS